MGGVCSSDDIYDNPEVRPFKQEFEALQLRRREIKKLYELFKRVDVDNSGSIGLNELLTHMDVDKTQFTERVFSIFDEDGSGEVDFREFVLALWNYCTLGSTTLDVFAFDLYDKDCSGFLGLPEIERMVHDIYGKHASSNAHAKHIISNLKKMSKELEINVEQFCVFCKNHQALLFPAFEMQLVLQNTTLGRYFWSRNAERRIQVSKGKFVPVNQFVELHISRNLRGHHKPSTAPTNDDAIIVQAIIGTKHDRQVKQTLLQLEAEHGHKFTEVPIVQSDVTERLYATGHYEEALARANLHPNKPSKHDETLAKLAVQTTEEAAIEKAKILKDLKKKAGHKDGHKVHKNHGTDDDDDEIGFEGGGGSGRRYTFPHPHVSEKAPAHQPMHLHQAGDIIKQENQVIKAAYPLDKVVHKPKPNANKEPHKSTHVSAAHHAVGHSVMPLKGSNDTVDELEGNSIATNGTAHASMGSPGKLPPLHSEHVVHHRGARDEYDHLKTKKLPAIPKSASHDEGDLHSHHGGKKPSPNSVHLGSGSHDENDHHHSHHNVKAAGNKPHHFPTVQESDSRQGSRNNSRSSTPVNSHRIAAH